MIGSISGTLIDHSTNAVLIETASGVGYKVYVGKAEFSNEQSIRLYTYHHVREDSSDLYGFKNLTDLAMFELLLTVSGVGPKMAQVILTSLGHDTVVDSIANNQPAIFCSVSGVGQRVAEKIIVELKNKVSSLGGPTIAGQENSELFEALLGFGYRQPEIVNVLKELDPAATTSEKLKTALKRLSK